MRLKESPWPLKKQTQKGLEPGAHETHSWTLPPFKDKKSINQISQLTDQSSQPIKSKNQTVIIILSIWLPTWQHLKLNKTQADDYTCKDFFLIE